MALDFFWHSLHERPSGKGARDYLAKRGIKPELIDDFQIGYVPRGWDNLLNYLTKKGYRAGIVVDQHFVAKATAQQGIDRHFQYLASYVPQRRFDAGDGAGE